MRLYLIAGEASGDLHGGNLVKAIKQIAPQAQLRAWGGDRMAAEGADLRKHYRDLAFMGFVEVVQNLRTISRNLDFCKKDIQFFKPDVLVLIDYPGFNLRIAKWAKKEGIKVVYYISPQIWAWHQSRVKNIKATVDEMLVILPFEQDFYQKHAMQVHYVGHPLLDEIGEVPSADNRDGSIALLAGSRKQEVERILPIMLEVAKRFPDRTFVLAGATALDADYYKKFLKNSPNIVFEQGKTYEILAKASAALCKSGTSTLETALYKVPQVVCYTGSPISYAIAKRVVRIDYISLVNLILGKPLVKELIQAEFSVENTVSELNALFEPSKRTEILEGYAELRTKLGGGGASVRAAAIIVETALKELSKTS